MWYTDINCYGSVNKYVLTCSNYIIKVKMWIIVNLAMKETYWLIPTFSQWSRHYVKTRDLLKNKWKYDFPLYETNTWQWKCV